MKHYAGLDLSMESTQVCIVDENGRKLVSEKAESSPEAITTMLERYGPIERAVIETGLMSPAICLSLRKLGVPVVCIDARQAHQEGDEGKQDRPSRCGWARTAGPDWLLQGGFERGISKARPSTYHPLLDVPQCGADPKAGGQLTPHLQSFARALRSPHGRSH